METIVIIIAKKEAYLVKNLTIIYKNKIIKIVSYIINEYLI